MSTTLAGLTVGPRWLEIDATEDRAEGPDGRRRWTALGALGEEGELDAPRGVVDPAGLVTAAGLGCSLDWWVGADDRWHFPSRETAVRQRLVDSAPVVETAMRVPGGDIIHRAYGARDRSGAPVLHLEIENASPVPVALGLAVRPYGPTGALEVHEVEVRGGDLVADGRVVARTERPPRLAAAVCGADGDVADVVTSGAVEGDGTAAARCPDGTAHAVAVHPLPHKAVLYVTVPLPGTRSSGPLGAPPAAQVASGWSSHVGRTTRIVLPDGRLTEAFDAARTATLLAATGVASVDGDGRVAVAERCEIASALAATGAVGESASLLAALAGTVDAAGGFGDADPRQDAPGAFLHTLAGLVALQQDDTLLDAVLPQAVGLAGVLGRGFRPGLGRRARLLGPGPRPAWVGHGVSAHDDLYGLAGMVAAAVLLERTGERAAARAIRRDAGAVRSLLSWLDDADSDISDPCPADAVAVDPLRLVEPRGPVAARLRGALTAASRGPMVTRGDGATGDPTLTLLAAGAELAAGEPAALDRLDWLVEVASPTWSWPGAVDPRTGEGASGDGCDVAVAARFVSVVRDLVVRDAGRAVEVLSVLPPAWRGQPVEVHDVPIGRGRLSIAVRWHGERPAVLWECETLDGLDPPTISAPGLDPMWRGEGSSGEALLAPHDDRAAAPPEEASTDD